MALEKMKKTWKIWALSMLVCVLLQSAAYAQEGCMNGVWIDNLQYTHTLTQAGNLITGILYMPEYDCVRTAVGYILNGYFFIFYINTGNCSNVVDFFAYVGQTDCTSASYAWFNSTQSGSGYMDKIDSPNTSAQ